MPYISVITINYNNAAGLEKTIGSVISQNFTDYEYIVIDGGSGDGSLQMINKYKDKFSYVVSERDKGIYDAQNKGLRSAKGDFLIFLNSGDRFHNENVLKEFADRRIEPDKKIIYGNTLIIKKDNTTNLLIPPQKPDAEFWYANTLNHQAIFTRRSVFNEFGEFNVNFKYASDFELFVKVFVKQPGYFQYIDLLVCDYDDGGVTSMDSHLKYILEERVVVLKRNFSKKEFKRIRKKYLRTLPPKKRFVFIVRENKKIRTILSPVQKMVKIFKRKTGNAN